MNQIAKVILDNEMDLILAHKQSMRLAELAGLSLGAQTTFATAVSEVSRNAIGKENAAHLTLYVSDKKEKLKYITVVLEDNRPSFSAANDEGYKYAKRLVQNISAVVSGSTNRIELSYRLPMHFIIDTALIDKWRISLNTDPNISPYEEIKRKNTQLIELAERLQEKEQQYKALTDSLPIMIFSMTNEATVTYANKWLIDYTGETIENINETKWQNILHPDDLKDAQINWSSSFSKADTIITPPSRLKHAKTGEYRWHTGVITAMKDEQGVVKSWNTYMVDIHAQKLVEETLKNNRQLKEIHAELEEKVNLLNRSNQQLEQFAYIASHDLQEPLRKISFYSDFLKEKYGKAMPEEAGLFFNNLVNATDRMKVLITDVLAYSTVRKDSFEKVSLDEIIKETLQDLEISIKEKRAEIKVELLPEIDGNSRQLKQLFENLISNSLKFSRPDVSPDISISGITDNDNVLLSFKDNGIGFEEQHIARMFDLFQRLHTRDKYSGTGIGLAICKKIIDMHNGSIMASGSTGNGATFLITLPLRQNNT